MLCLLSLPVLVFILCGSGTQTLGHWENKKPPHRRDPVRTQSRTLFKFKVYQTRRNLSGKSRTFRILSSCRTQGELHSSGMMGHTSSSLEPLTQSCSFYRTEPSFRFCTRHLIGWHLILPEHINNS